MSFFSYSLFETKKVGQRSHILFRASNSGWIKVNDTGFEIARHLDQGEPVRDLLLHLKRKYGIASEVARNDVLQVQDELARNGFLQPNCISQPFRFPTLNSVYFRLTRRCNLVCPHCYVSCSDKSGRDDLPTSQVLRLIDELADSGGESVTLSGGEPLLHPEIKKILKHAARKVTVRFLTNGTLIDRKWADFLADMDISIQISIDGSSREVHDSIRGSGTFERSMRGLENLQEAGAGDRINFSTTVMNQNLHDLSRIISLAEEVHVSQVRFLPLRRMGRAKREWETIGSGLTIKDSERFYEYTSRLQRNGESGVDISCGLSGFLLKMPEEFEEDDIWCYVGTQLVIDVNGDVYPCPLMMGDDFKLGNVLNDRMEKVMRTDVMAGLCHALSERRQKIKECSTCTWRNMCQAGCMAQALDNKGTIWDTDDFCDYRKRAYKEAFDRILNIDD
jgi:radical SAM protein with 4Fe4S-binding SPASM domain